MPDAVLRSKPLRVARRGRCDCKQLRFRAALQRDGVNVRDELRADDADFDFLAHESSGFGVLKGEACRTDYAGVMAELGFRNFEAAFRNLSRTRNLLTHRFGENLKMFLADST